MTAERARIIGLWLTAFAVGLGSGFGWSRLGQAATRPNILFIYLDDFGWRDASYMGSDFYETPHIDALAHGGMYFTNAYACAANCAPSRACLLSGQYTPRHHIFNVGTRPRGKAENRRLEHIAGTDTLDPAITTWAECLQQAGYATGMFGKWHLGGDPKTQGFDVAMPHDKIAGRQGHRLPNGEYLTDRLTDAAIEFMRQEKDGPWCVYLPHLAVHTPLQAKENLLQKYATKPPGTLHQHVVMATMVECVDAAVGRLVAVLDEWELRRNTAIIISSDNGGYGPATDMDPLWGYKGTYYEGGIRVPLLVNWPAVVRSGQVCDVPVIGVDMYPTLLEIAECPAPSQPSDGVSLLPLLTNQLSDLGDRPLFWHFPAYLESYSVTNEQRDPLFRTRPCSVVRWGDWKLHQYYETNDVELYNLRSDIREQTNLANDQPERTAQLRNLLDDWKARVGAPVPQRRVP